MNDERRGDGLDGISRRGRAEEEAHDEGVGVEVVLYGGACDE